ISHHIPVFDKEAKTSRRAEIDFLITKNTVITTYYEALPHLEDFFQEVLRDKAIQKELLTGQSYVLVHKIIEHLIHFSLRQLAHIEDRVSYIAKEIFAKHGHLLKIISQVKRDILEYRLIIRPHEEMLKSLEHVGEKFWGPKSTVYLSDISGENLHLSQHLETYYQVIESLEQTNAQILNITTNNIIKRFTILAFLITFPLFYIFAMGVPYIDALINTPTKFWTIFFIIFGIVGYLIFLFKKKKML
ncbi:MAG: CorA family divalent cation transporter, partial [Candidatus Paceibacterota bacterium]